MGEGVVVQWPYIIMPQSAHSASLWHDPNFALVRLHVDASLNMTAGMPMMKINLPYFHMI